MISFMFWNMIHKHCSQVYCHLEIHINDNFNRIIMTFVLFLRHQK